MVSIIIVNYNQKNLLKQCLRNISEADIKIDYEIIIIDNNSEDESKEFLAGLYSEPNINIILNNTNNGFAMANNQGIRLSKYKYVLSLNPDVIVQSGAIEKLYNFLETNSDTGIVAPQLLNPDKTIQNSCCRFPKWYIPILRRTFLGKMPILKKELSKYLMLDFDHQQTREIDWAIGACLMIRKKMLNKIGLFDEKYFLYFEDVDLARRAWKADFKVHYYPTAVMFHFHQRVSAEKSLWLSIFSKITWIHIASAFKYFLK